MEKSFIVTNKKFLKEIEDFWEGEKKRNEFIKKFFTEKGIAETGYYICGNGRINAPFKDYEKGDIRLYINDCEENERKFGKQLLKPRRFDDGSSMRCFRKNSAILKEFQELCIDCKIIINNRKHREGDYFKELTYGGYSVEGFESEGKYYLKMSALHDGITPMYDGFEEIKLSDFYLVLENFQISN